MTGLWQRHRWAEGLLLVLLAGADVAGAQPSAAGMRPLVVPLEHPRDAPSLHWLGEGAAILLTEDLTTLGTVPVGREDRLLAFARLNVPASATLSHATVLRLGKVVGATHVVVGRFELAAGRLSVHVRAVRIDGWLMLPEVVEDGPIEDAFRVFGRVARRLVPGATTDPDPGRFPPMAAFEPYVKGLLATTPAAQLGYLEQALRLAPNLHRARLAQWAVYDEQGNHAAALGAVRGVPDGDPLSRRARFGAALSLMGLARLDEAAATLTGLAQQHADPAVLNNLGVIQMRRSQPAWSAAAGWFAQASAVDRTDADLFFNAGYAAWWGRDYPRAVAALREVVRRDPADDQAHYILGMALQATGSAVEAARERELARRLSSTVADWERQQPAGQPVPRGLERIKTSIDVPDALRAAGTLAESQQRDQREQAAFHLDRAHRLLHQEHDAEALEELRRALFLAPYQGEAHLLMGRIFLKTGRLKDATDAFKIAVWSEDSNGARLALADAYRQGQEPGLARAELDVVLARDPGNAEARRMLAELR